MTVDVILPAGGRIDGRFARDARAHVKALIDVGGEAILTRTLRALRESGRIRHAVVVGPDSVRGAAEAADAVVPEGASGPENVYRGVDWLAQHAGALRALVMATDLPFVTADSIRTFLDACPVESDISVPIHRREEFHARFPDGPATFVRLRDGEWTLGCAFLLDIAAIQRNRRRIAQVFEARKSQARMAALLGPLFLMQLLTRRAGISHIERRCAQILGCSGAAVPGCDPALAFDIDRPDELAYARSVLDRRRMEAS